MGPSTQTCFSTVDESWNIFCINALFFLVIFPLCAGEDLARKGSGSASRPFHVDINMYVCALSYCKYETVVFVFII